MIDGSKFIKRRKIRKRMVVRSFLFLIVMGLMMTVGVRADGPYTEGYFIYETDGDGVKIAGYFGDEEEVTVPDLLGGLYVRELDGATFRSSKIRTVTLPETLVEISNDSFGYAAGLESVYLYSDVEVSVPEHVLVVRNVAEYVDEDVLIKKYDADIKEIKESDVNENNDVNETSIDNVLVMEMEYEDGVIDDPDVDQVSLISVKENTVNEYEDTDDLVSRDKMDFKAISGSDLLNYIDDVFVIYGTVIVSLFGLFLVLFLFYC